MATRGIAWLFLQKSCRKWHAFLHPSFAQQPEGRSTGGALYNHGARSDQRADFAVLIADVHVGPIVVIRFCGRGLALLEAGLPGDILRIFFGGWLFEGGGAEVPKADTARAVPERIPERFRSLLRPKIKLLPVRIKTAVLVERKRGNNGDGRADRRIPPGPHHGP